MKVRVRTEVRYCLKFHLLNLNGYSDFSAVEGIVGGGEGEWEGEETRGIQVGVKINFLALVIF